VLVIRRIHLTLRLAAPEEVRDGRARPRMYAMSCPYRTLHTAIQLTSSYTLIRRLILMLPCEGKGTKLRRESWVGGGRKGKPGYHNGGAAKVPKHGCAAGIAPRNLLFPAWLPGTQDVLYARGGCSSTAPDVYV
jgi:hypothetical protein